jgi:hypothetical protein
MKTPSPPATVTATTYGNAEVRGKLRIWKTERARVYERFLAVFSDHARMRLLNKDLVFKRSAKGRQRAFAKLARSLGSGLNLEGLQLEGDYPVAVWSIIRPSHSLVSDPTPQTSLAQDCVTVNYASAGCFLGSDNHTIGGVSTGFWQLEVPDHALGRAIERSRTLPDTIISEAHHNLLRMRVETIWPFVKDDRSFLLTAGAGAFICVMNYGGTASRNVVLYARAVTWLASEMLHESQVPLVPDTGEGDRLGDTIMLPGALCRATEDAQGEIQVTHFAGQPPVWRW